MKRKYLLGFLLALVIILPACSSSEVESQEQIQVFEIELSSAQNDYLKPEVVLLESDEVILDGYKAKLVGAQFNKATDDIMLDSQMGGGLVNESFEDGTGRGFAIGFMNSSNSEIEKMDAYLALYFEFIFEADNISQRDSVKPELELYVTDNQGAELVEIYNSLEDAYVNVESPYSVMLYKGYYDSSEFNINVNDKIYNLQTEILMQ